jgi:exportin-T
MILTSLVLIHLKYKKSKQVSPQTHITPEKRQFLQTTLGILIDKLKWDEDEDPDEMDPDDLMMFDNMRKVRKAF